MKNRKDALQRLEEIRSPIKWGDLFGNFVLLYLLTLVMSFSIIAVLQLCSLLSPQFAIYLYTMLHRAPYTLIVEF